MNRFGSFSRPRTWFMALVLAAFVAGCGGGGDSASPAGPAVAPTNPGAGQALEALVDEARRQSISCQ